LKGEYYEEFMAQYKIHPRWNNDIYNLYKDLNIMDDTNIRRLGWVGHIVRMEDERFPKKKVLNGKFYNTRPAGKLRTR
jgi:hypothetical protein